MFVIVRGTEAAPEFLKSHVKEQWTDEIMLAIGFRKETTAERVAQILSNELEREDIDVIVRRGRE